MLAFALLVLFGFSACNKQKAALPQPPPPEVTVVKVSSTAITIFDEYAAQTEAVEPVQIRARVDGILQRQAFKDGAPVRKGELLFVIDPRPFISALALAKANLAQAQATLVNSRQNLVRLRPLVASQAISRQEYDAAVARELADAANVEAGKARVRQAQLDLDYTTIRAPRDGMISKAQVKPGGLVDRSATLLTTLYSIDPIYVSFTISEQKLAELQKHYDLRDPAKRPSVRLKLIDGTDYPHNGKLDFLDAAVDPRNGTLPVRVLTPNPEGALRHGQFVRAIMPAREVPDAVLVPQKAVQELQGKHSIFVIGPDNKAVHRDVETSARVGNDWVVEQGLKPGELVVVEGIAKVKPGSAVKPVPAGQAQRDGGKPAQSPSPSAATPAKPGG
jgi:membrane fusion protein (multidrug efflux system)